MVREGRKNAQSARALIFTEHLRIEDGHGRADLVVEGVPAEGGVYENMYSNRNRCS